MTKTQIDRLGDRLRKGDVSERDLELLDSYRRSFANAYETVITSIRDQLALEPTGRPAKSTTSVSEKLRRESIRLTQIQDMAGCRLIVADIVAQDSVVAKLTQLFEQAATVDRRQYPSHGYRAVHVIVTSGGKIVEIQVRTSLQHLWAELSEKFADVVDPSIKYGGGAVVIRSILERTSTVVAKAEEGERRLAVLTAVRSKADMKKEITEGLDSYKEQIADLLREAIALVAKQKGEDRAVSD